MHSVFFKYHFTSFINWLTFGSRLRCKFVRFWYIGLITLKLSKYQSKHRPENVILFLELDFYITYLNQKLTKSVLKYNLTSLLKCFLFRCKFVRFCYIGLITLKLSKYQSKHRSENLDNFFGNKQATSLSTLTLMH